MYNCHLMKVIIVFTSHFSKELFKFAELTLVLYNTLVCIQVKKCQKFIKTNRNKTNGDTNVIA